MSIRPLAPLFAGLLASLTSPACNPGGYGECGLIYDIHDVEIPTDELAPYLEDMNLFQWECARICHGEWDDPIDGSTTAEPTTGAGESTGESTGGSSGGSTGESTGGSSSGTMPDDEYEEDYSELFCEALAGDGGISTVRCNEGVIGSCGRRPVGWAGGACAAEVEPGLAWLLAAAELEAASVPAFVALATELAELGAPDALRDAAVRAADDERRHAVAIASLVRGRGREVAAPEITANRAGDLEALARHNAVEGCVRETWGALLAAFQARHAEAADVRRVQLEIADDERGHAELAWEIDAWARTRLSAAAQARVDAARADAARALLGEAERFAVGVPEVGLPNATQARALLCGLRAALW